MKITRGSVFTWKPTIERGPFVWGIHWGYWWLRLDECEAA